MINQAIAMGRSLPLKPLLILLGLGAGLVWAYWPAFCSMQLKWQHDPQYSHGYLVPLFAVALLAIRWPMMAQAALRPSWWSLPLLAVAIAGRLPAESLNFAQELLEGGSLLLLMAGLCLLLGGWPVLHWAWPAIGFLVFMFPLPWSVEHMLGWELRKIATVVSTYVLQTLGFPSVADGNKIILEKGPIGVEEACSGLSMMMTFVALSVAVIFIFERRLLDKIIILLSAVPIAIVSNVARITVTATMMEVMDRQLAYKFFHDYAGWFMMVLALGLLLGELKLLSLLLIERVAVPKRAAPAAVHLNTPLPIHQPARLPGLKPTVALDPSTAVTPLPGPVLPPKRESSEAGQRKQP